ncbi:hypothetical protein QR680_017004 [Steinernema hermaphroditum]|uniref:GRIP domain-containing protein n=1 Tax=Steinernema hermaphroditum TaxID=289476 RepID=A0AA39HDY4_9BILA|nr:hypothetical protein QR680_017004 [Steinernema hermaphroditum]
MSSRGHDDEAEPQPSSSASYFITPAIAGTRIPTMPKKGILKRPSSLLTRRSEGRELPVTNGASRLTTSSSQPNIGTLSSHPKPQKLSVGWSEKNAVAIFGDTSDEYTTETESDGRISLIPTMTRGLRQTAILTSEDESEGPPPEECHFYEANGFDAIDEVASVTSSTGSSQIAGKWWFGKDLRYVTHCDKRGCNHKNHEPGDYLTPTQRKNRELQHIKKELKEAQQQVTEKERHLVQLRERLKEIETMMNSNQTLNENHRLMAREKQLVEDHQREKQTLLEKHEVRVRQLIQETVEARAEMMRKGHELDEIRRRQSEMVDEETMTEVLQTAPSAVQAEPASAPITDRSNAMVMSDPSLSMMSPMSPQSPQQYLSQEALNQLQAYHNEALIWRTKAAQLEIVVKDQLLRTSQSESSLVNDLENSRREIERLREYVRRLEASNPSMVDSGIDTVIITGSPQHQAPSPVMGVECLNPACLERKRSLAEENKQLVDRMSEEGLRIRELEDDVNHLRHLIDKTEDRATKLVEKNRDLVKEFDAKSAETSAAHMAVKRLQAEKETLAMAVSHLEEKIEVYRNTLMDNDLIVQDETENWRRGFAIPGYSVMNSRRVQTELTSEELGRSENEFVTMHARLKELQSEFAYRNMDMHSKFAEVEQNLLLKTGLVESLGRQLESAACDAQVETKRRQGEREQLQNRINEMAKEIERIPLLEMEIEKLQAEKSALDLRILEARAEYDRGLEHSLDGSLKKYRELSGYWAEKMEVADKGRARIEAELQMLEKEHEQLKLRMKVEKADLEQRLTSSIDHVTQLNSRVNCSTRDAQCVAFPKQTSKYVACKPNFRHKQTSIEHGELFDEGEERLKLCQGELLTTRRQVQVLQQKLIEMIEKQPGDPRQSDKALSPIPFESKPAPLSPVDVEKDDEIAELEAKNRELQAKLRENENDKANMLKREKERIKQLVAEFDNVRKELDQEIRRYESEKRRMLERIQKLENSKMLQGEPAGPERSSRSQSPSPPVKRSASVPVLTVTSTDSEENEPSTGNGETSLTRTFSTTADPEVLRAKNVYLLKKNAELTEQMARLKISVEDSIKRTVSKVSQKSSSCRSELSPGFSDLATDLNQVRSDLELILTQMEEKPEVTEKSPPTVQWHLERDPSETEAEKRRVEKALERSRAERTALTAELDRVTSELHAAWRELELFRKEPREEAHLHHADPRMLRSRSVVELAPMSVNGDEHQKWREKTGVMFRELNRLRKQFAEADVERRDLRAEVRILRGEVEMAKAQAGLSRTAGRSFLGVFERNSATPMSSRHRRDSSGTYATARMSMFSLHELPCTSEPDLTRSLDPKGGELMTSSWHERAAYAEERAAEADRRQMNLEAELSVVKEAFRKQLSTLKERNKELEGKVKALEEEKETDAAKTKVAYNDELVEDHQVAILKKENELYEKKIRELEDERQEMYLVMFKKGQQAAHHDLAEGKIVDQMTEDRIVLRFLHDAFYYYLLNKGDSREHLQAMMTMLNFTSSQKDEVYRHRRGSSHHH